MQHYCTCVNLLRFWRETSKFAIFRIDYKFDFWVLGYISVSATHVSSTTKEKEEVQGSNDVLQDHLGKIKKC